MKTSRKRSLIFWNALPLLLLADLSRSYLEPKPSNFFLKLLISILAGGFVLFRSIRNAVRPRSSRPASKESTGTRREEGDPK